MSRCQRVIQSNNDKINSIEAVKFTLFGDEIKFNNSEQNQNESVIPYSEEEARIILEQANIEAESIIANAKLEAEEIKKKAYQFGYEEGQRSALALVNETLENISKLLGNAVNETINIKEEIIANAESNIIELAIAIAEKLVCHEIDQKEDFIIELVKESIRIAKSANEFVLKINPSDRAMLEKNTKDILDFIHSTTFDVNTKLIIEDDDEILPGNCILVTDKNIFDMTFKSRLDSIIEAINKHRLHEQNGKEI